MDSKDEAVRETPAEPERNGNVPDTLSGVGPRVFLVGEHVGARVVVTRSVRVEARIGAHDRVSVVTPSPERPAPRSQNWSDDACPFGTATLSESAAMSDVFGQSASGQSALHGRARALPPPLRNTRPSQPQVVDVPPSSLTGPIRPPRPARKSAPLQPGRINRAPTRLVVGSVVALAGAAGLTALTFSKRYVTTRAAQVDARVAPVRSQLAGSLQRVYVRPNQKVHAGELLAELDATEWQLRVDEARANWERAQAVVASAESVMAPAVQSGQTDPDDAHVALAKLEAKLVSSGRMQAQLGRELAEQQARARTLEQEIAELRRAFQSGAENKPALGAALAALRQTHSRISELQVKQTTSIGRAQQLTISAIDARRRIGELERAQRENQDSERAAHWQLTASKSLYDEALRKLGLTKLYAPFDGVVSAELASAGDYVAPGTRVMSLWQNTSLWVTASFDENALPQLARGQVARLHVRALDLDLRGRVESVAFGSEARLRHEAGGFATYDATAPQRVPVRIALDPGQPGGKRLRPGMTVETRVLLP